MHARVTCENTVKDSTSLDDKMFFVVVHYWQTTRRLAVVEVDLDRTDAMFEAAEA